jgi:hypothetical protein
LREYFARVAALDDPVEPEDFLGVFDVDGRVRVDADMPRLRSTSGGSSCTAPLVSAWVEGVEALDLSVERKGWR